VERLLDDWVENCILGDIGQMLRHRSSGNYPVAALLFSVIDLLGGLQRGNVEGNHRDNMIAFMQRYLARVDPRYRSIGYLLVDMFRHPLVHTSLSRSYRARAGRYVIRSAIYWEEDTRRRRQLIARRKAHLVRKMYKASDYLIINDHVLHDDVVRALGMYRQELLSGRYRVLARRFSSAYDRAMSAVNLWQLRKQRAKHATMLARQIGRVRRWPATRAKCFADE
jgi:hypothetical protein